MQHTARRVTCAAHSMQSDLCSTQRAAALEPQATIVCMRGDLNPRRAGEAWRIKPSDACVGPVLKRVCMPVNVCMHTCVKVRADVCLRLCVRMCEYVRVCEHAPGRAHSCDLRWLTGACNNARIRMSVCVLGCAHVCMCVRAYACFCACACMCACVHPRAFG